MPEPEEDFLIEGLKLSHQNGKRLGYLMGITDCLDILQAHKIENNHFSHKVFEKIVSLFHNKAKERG